MSNRLRSIIRGWALCALLVFTPLASSQVYEWRDANGNISYGDSPPPGVEARQVDLPRGPSPEQVEAAQQRLETILEARATASEPVPSRPPAQAEAPVASGPFLRPEFPCYTPMEQVLNGPVRDAYDGINPTQLTGAQRSNVEAFLASVQGNRTGTGYEMNCFGKLEEPREERREWEIRSRASWQGRDGLLTMENSARNRSRRANETRTAFLMVSDALYFFEAKGDGQGRVNRNMAKPGNAVEGLHLDKNNLAFMIKDHTWNANPSTFGAATGHYIVRTEIRLLTIDGSALTYTELYFYENRLAGSRVWKFR